MEETRIDAVPTPAHIFAYRAFRSVFVHSPESSPVRPQPDPYTSSQYKENAHHSPARHSRFTTSPVQSKRKDDDLDVNFGLGGINLTPKRQKMMPVSPTKSILKRPNVLTPRRESLRDVTVTFKDLRKSVSPEAVRRGSPTRVGSQHELQGFAKMLGEVEVPVAKSKGAVVEVRAVSHPMPKLRKTTTTEPIFDLDAYVAQTEKEMRRLIKYAHKWKEQARKQEDQNAQLDLLLEDMRKENERLRKKLEAQDKTTGTNKSPGKQVALPNKSMKENNEKPKKRQLLEEKLQQVYQAQEEQSKPHKGPHAQSISQVAAEERVKRESHSKRQANEKDLSVDKPRNKSAQPSITQEPHVELQQQTKFAQHTIFAEPERIDKDRQVSDSTMTNARKAAARERLERRRLQRQTSMQLPGSARKEQSKLVVDESAVDWVAAAL